MPSASLFEIFWQKACPSMFDFSPQRYGIFWDIMVSTGNACFNWVLDIIGGRTGKIEEEEKQAVREVPPKTTKTAPVAPRVPAQPLIQRPTIVAKTVEAKTIEGDEEATTPPIQEPTQTVEERPFSDAENEKEKRD